MFVLNVLCGSMFLFFKLVVEVLFFLVINLMFWFWGVDDFCVESSILFLEIIVDGYGVMLI